MIRQWHKDALQRERERERERVTCYVASGIVLDSLRLVYGLPRCVRGNSDVGVTMSVFCTL